MKKSVDGVAIGVSTQTLYNLYLSLLPYATSDYYFVNSFSSGSLNQTYYWNDPYQTGIGLDVYESNPPLFDDSVFWSTGTHCLRTDYSYYHLQSTPQDLYFGCNTCTRIPTWNCWNCASPGADIGVSAVYYSITASSSSSFPYGINTTDNLSVISASLDHKRVYIQGTMGTSANTSCAYCSNGTLTGYMGGFTSQPFYFVNNPTVGMRTSVYCYDGNTSGSQLESVWMGQIAGSYGKYYTSGTWESPDMEIGKVSFWTPFVYNYLVTGGSQTVSVEVKAATSESCLSTTTYQSIGNGGVPVFQTGNDMWFKVRFTLTTTDSDYTPIITSYAIRYKRIN
jgi:hypothetical protein